MADLTESRSNFKKWFVDVFESLKEDPNAGFVLAMTSFPLLERYLRRKSGAEPKQPKFQEALLDVIHELRTPEVAKNFWESYRHGLLHNVLLNRDKDWLSLDVAEVVLIDGFGRVWMNPLLFARRVLETIEKDFPTFTQEPGLPQPQVEVIPAGLAGLATGVFHQIVIGTGGTRKP